MKFCASILAIFALSKCTNAFTVHHPTHSFRTGLAATNDADTAQANRVDAAPTPATKSPNKPTSSLSSDEVRPTKEIFDELDQITVQGGSLRTCSFKEGVRRAAVFLKTEGRPLTANVDLWQGPDNTPQKMAVFLEDGNKRPFRAIVETPGSSNAVSIRNTAQLEYPLTAGVEVDMTGESETPSFDRNDYRIVQGGAVYTTPFAPAVQSIRVSLKSDGRPLNARVELLQGPNNNKQVMEIYSEDGLERPFNAIIDSPGVGNVVRIVNTATVEFPLSAAVEPYLVYENMDYESSDGITWR